MSISWNCNDQFYCKNITKIGVKLPYVKRSIFWCFEAIVKCICVWKSMYHQVSDILYLHLVWLCVILVCIVHVAHKRKISLFHFYLFSIKPLLLHFLIKNISDLGPRWILNYLLHFYVTTPVNFISF